MTDAPALPKKRRSVWLLALVLGYAAATAVVVVLLQFFVDRFWVATALAFLPRWILALPAPIVLGVCAYARDLRASGVVVASLVAQLFWVGGLKVSIPHAAVPREQSLRVLTQNADSVPFSSGWLTSLVKDNDLDLVLIQECPVSSAVITPSPIEGYAFEKDINTCVLSRYPFEKTDLRPRKDVWARGGSGAISLYEITAPFGTFAVMNVHFATARNGLNGFRQFGLGGIATTQENQDLRRWESEVAREWSTRTTAPLLVAGDFNMPEESRIFHASWSDLGSAFDACGNGFGYSKETVLRGIEYGTRIDHVLFDSRWTCHAAHLGPEMGSDHRGMFAELSLK